MEMSLRLENHPPLEIEERALELLEVMGLSQRLHHLPPQISGGEQQRVSIARALATRPDLILADEPTGELDTTTTHQIMALFKHLVEKEGITVLLATHDPIIDEYADIMYTIQDGLLAVPATVMRD